MCRYGLYRGLTFDLDLASQTQVWLGLWERETYSFIRRAARSCRWAVDVGAGQGELSVYLLKKSSAEIIFAIEPQEIAIAALQTNLDLAGENGSARVQVLNKFCGTTTEEDVIALDSLALDRSKPGFIKIDVDGPECDVLDSGASLLTEADVLLLVETHSQDLEHDCIGRLVKLGYECTIIRNAWWRLLVPEHRPIEHNRWLWAEKPASA